MMETVHRGEFSRDMELAAIASCGRWAQVEDLRTGAISTVNPPDPPKKAPQMKRVPRLERSKRAV